LGILKNEINFQDCKTKRMLKNVSKDVKNNIPK
jgi:hypothetical protein